MELSETIAGWFVKPDTFYLIGAGCSRCANKPLIDALTQEVVQDLLPKVKSIFDNLKTTPLRKPNIEDLINHLLRTNGIIESMNVVNIDYITAEEITDALIAIRKGVAKAIGYEWSSSNYHERFVQRIRGRNHTREIFTLNYDTVIEASLEACCIPYTDGFTGAENAYFTPNSFQMQRDDTKNEFAIHKLHGSINWIREKNDQIRRRPLGSLASEDSLPSMVYPSEQKYLETQFGAYEILLRKFRDRLRNSKQNNTLISLGYSFNDEHINYSIVDAVRNEHCNLTIYAFVGSENDLVEQQRKLIEIASECPAQINFYVGSDNSGFFVGDALEKEQSEELLSYELWKFENVVSFLCGENYEQ